MTGQNDREHAEALWQDLRNAFLNFKEILQKIIDERAWIPLGYSSFGVAWKHYMSDITLASEIRPHVVWPLLAEKLSDDEISETVKDVGPEAAKNYRRQWENGIPADHATAANSPSNRKPKPKPKSQPKPEPQPKPKPEPIVSNESTIVVGPYPKNNGHVDQYAVRVEFTAETIAEWHRLAELNSTTLKAVAKLAIENAFASLALLEKEAS